MDIGSLQSHTVQDQEHQVALKIENKFDVCRLIKLEVYIPSNNDFLKYGCTVLVDSGRLTTH